MHLQSTSLLGPYYKLASRLQPYLQVKDREKLVRILLTCRIDPQEILDGSKKIYAEQVNSIKSNLPESALGISKKVRKIIRIKCLTTLKVMYVQGPLSLQHYIWELSHMPAALRMHKKIVTAEKEFEAAKKIYEAFNGFEVFGRSSSDALLPSEKQLEKAMIYLLAKNSSPYAIYRSAVKNFKQQFKYLEVDTVKDLNFWIRHVARDYAYQPNMEEIRLNRLAEDRQEQRASL